MLSITNAMRTSRRNGLRQGAAITYPYEVTRRTDSGRAARDLRNSVVARCQHAEPNKKIKKHKSRHNHTFTAYIIIYLYKIKSLRVSNYQTYRTKKKHIDRSLWRHLMSTHRLYQWKSTGYWRSSNFLAVRAHLIWDGGNTQIICVTHAF